MCTKIINKCKNCGTLQNLGETDKYALYRGRAYGERVKNFAIQGAEILFDTMKSNLHCLRVQVFPDLLLMP